MCEMVVDRPTFPASEDGKGGLAAPHCSQKCRAHHQAGICLCLQIVLCIPSRELQSPPPQQWFVWWVKTNVLAYLPDTPENVER